MSKKIKTAFLVVSPYQCNELKWNGNKMINRRNYLNLNYLTQIVVLQNRNRQKKITKIKKKHVGLVEESPVFKSNIKNILSKRKPWAFYSSIQELGFNWNNAKAIHHGT